MAKQSSGRRRAVNDREEITSLGIADADGKSNGLPVQISGTAEQPDATARWSSVRKYRAALKNRWWAAVIVGVLTLSALGGTLKYLERDAQRLVAERNRQGYLHNSKEEGLLSKANPFLTDPPPAPTPKLSKEYVYAGSRMLAVEDANASQAIPADLAVWRPSSGQWFVMGPNSTVAASQSWGASGDTPEPGDYDGDGRTDFAVYRDGVQAGDASNWYVIKSSDGSYLLQGWGIKGDLAAPADYDGDHRTDLAVFRPSNHTWYVQRSRDNQLGIYDFGSSSGDAPVPADYDGDGKADVAVFRQANSTFYALSSLNGQLLAGQPSTTVTNGAPVTGDYDGDGKADFAIRSGVNWVIQSNNNSGSIQTINWQQAGDTAVQNDYDGDGKTDIAVWRSDGSWFIRQSSRIGQANELRTASWGASGDTPVPAFWRRLNP